MCAAEDALVEKRNELVSILCESERFYAQTFAELKYQGKVFNVGKFLREKMKNQEGIQRAINEIDRALDLLEQHQPLAAWEKELLGIS
jgi:hypothetical protein